MRFKCECGNIIRDQSDMIRYKGRVISDLDYIDFFDVIENAVLNNSDNISKKEYEQNIMNIYVKANEMFSSAYECTNCGRLFFDKVINEGRFVDYIPSNSEYNKAFYSNYGDAWKKPLIASWSDEAKWGNFISYIEGGVEVFSWDEMKVKYYELFEKFKNEDTLRHSVLKCNGETIHEWNESE